LALGSGAIRRPCWRGFRPVHPFLSASWRLPGAGGLSRQHLRLSVPARLLPVHVLVVSLASASFGSDGSPAVWSDRVRAPSSRVLGGCTSWPLGRKLYYLILNRSTMAVVVWHCSFLRRRCRSFAIFFSEWKHLNYHVGSSGRGTHLNLPNDFIFCLTGSSGGGTHLNLPNDFIFCLTVYRGRIIFLFNI
jgi:hypothetical protein